MATAKQLSIRLLAEDVTVLEHIQNELGFIGLSDAMRYALRQYAKACGISSEPKSQKKTKPKTR